MDILTLQNYNREVQAGWRILKSHFGIRLVQPAVLHNWFFQMMGKCQLQYKSGDSRVLTEVLIRLSEDWHKGSFPTSRTLASSTTKKQVLHVFNTLTSKPPPFHYWDNLLPHSYSPFPVLAVVYFSDIGRASRLWACRTCRWAHRSTPSIIHMPTSSRKPAIASCTHIVMGGNFGCKFISQFYLRVEAEPYKISKNRNRRWRRIKFTAQIRWLAASMSLHSFQSSVSNITGCLVQLPLTRWSFPDTQALVSHQARVLYSRNIHLRRETLLTVHCFFA